MLRPHIALIFSLTVPILGCASRSAVPGLTDFRTARPESAGMSGERLARLDGVLDAHVDAGRIPGYQLLIARRGRLVHQRVYGAMDREAGRPMAHDTIFRIYSMSKVVTGVATLIALEQGHFLLGDRISKYLPAFASPKVLERGPGGRLREVDAQREITVLDLLRHTSGLSYSFLAPPPLGAKYVAASITPGIRGLPDDTGLGPVGKDRSATLADMVERLGKLPLVAEPGSAWHYGVNIDVLGRLIEVTSGQSFPDFLRAHLFEPLDMRDSGFFVPGRQARAFRRVLRRHAGGRHATARCAGDQRVSPSRPPCPAAEAAWCRPRATTCAWR